MWPVINLGICRSANGGNGILSEVVTGLLYDVLYACKTSLQGTVGKFTTYVSVFTSNGMLRYMIHNTLKIRYSQFRCITYVCWDICGNETMWRYYSNVINKNAETVDIQTMHFVVSTCWQPCWQDEGAGL